MSTFALNTWMVAWGVGVAVGPVGGAEVDVGLDVGGCSVGVGVDVEGSSVGVSVTWGVSVATGVSVAGRVVGVAVESGVGDGNSVGVEVGAGVHAARIRTRIARHTTIHCPE